MTTCEQIAGFQIPERTAAFHQRGVTFGVQPRTSLHRDFSQTRERSLTISLQHLRPDDRDEDDAYSRLSVERCKSVSNVFFFFFFL